MHKQKILCPKIYCYLLLLVVSTNVTDSMPISQSEPLGLSQRQFTYSEVLKITNNFEKIVGRGGFGLVHHGYIGDAQVAVKMFSPSAIQGFKNFIQKYVISNR